MSLGNTEEAVEVIGLFILPLWILLPLNAMNSIRQRRQNRPGSSCWFAYTVIGGWVAVAIAYVFMFITSAWYSENGSESQAAIGEMALFLLALVVLHVILVAIGKPITRTV